MDIIVKTIPHSSQRYPTVGDWYFDNEETPQRLYIMISDMGNIYYEFLVAQHEQVEAMLCLKHGVKEKQVSDFDINFEANREAFNIDEPGDSIEAPYHLEHSIATLLEKKLAQAFELDWGNYDSTVNAL